MATDGKEIIEFDVTASAEPRIGQFPSPDDLWEPCRWGERLAATAAQDRLQNSA